MLLFPLVMTVLRPGSPMRNWPAWLGVYGCMTFDSYYTIRLKVWEHLARNWEDFGKHMERLTVTFGWSLLLIAVFFSLLWRYLDVREAEREPSSAPAPTPRRGYAGRVSTDPTDYTALTDEEGRPAHPHGVPGAAPRRHRTRVLRRIHRHEDDRRIPLPRVRRRVVPQRRQFESHCGWPSFFTPLAGDKIIERSDTSAGMLRTEVLCANCHSHLGHVFAGEGYGTPTDLRYCINSVCLSLEPAE